MIRVAIFILLSACSHDSVQSIDYDIPKTKEDCMQLFTDIMDIQKQREAGFTEMQKQTAIFKAGNISVKKYRKKRIEWLNFEREMRNKVTKMYDIGYEHKCFDKQKVHESR